MHYEIQCEITEEFTKLVTENMLILYDKYKDDEKIFPKNKNDDKQ